MPKIYAIGETVYDIIFKDGVPVTAKAGGSMLNTTVSLGRMGLDVNFISDLGEDMIGDEIIKFLNNNGVHTQSVQRYSNHKSSIAIAFLDDSNNASYTFYRDYPEKRLQGLKVSFSPGDIFLFGSFFALTPEIRQILMEVISEARRSGCIIIYDPNFRKAHLHEIDALRPFIRENIRSADLVRGSDEDFRFIYDAGTAEDAFSSILKEGCGNLVYTANKNGVTAISGNFKHLYQVPPVKVISTIGAGDNFNAGIIWSIVKNGLAKRDLENTGKEVWDRLIPNGIDFAAEVCGSYDNYISAEFAEKRKKI